MCIGIARFFAERGLTAEATPLLDQAQRWLENAGYSRWLDEIARIRELPTADSFMGGQNHRTAEGGQNPRTTTGPREND
jgi:hypothetical protein